MTAIVLAGGKSRRLGVNKAFLELDGLTLIERVLAGLKNIFSEIVIVTNSKSCREMRSLFQNGPRVVEDIFEDKGPLAGLYTGLLSTRCQAAFTVACDMPFLHEELILYLSRQLEGFDAVVPLSFKGYEPLHSIYGQGCRKIIEEQLIRNELRPRQIFPYLRVRYVRPEEIETFDPRMLSFTNINTLEDYRKISGDSRLWSSL